MLQRNRLTDAKVRAARPREKAYKLADGAGLFLHVTPHGSRLWRWRFWLSGKEQVFAIGSYPDVGIAEARKAADAARGLVEAGINPAHAREDERRRNLAAAEARRRAGDGALAKLAEAWLAAGKSAWSPGTYRNKRKRLERFIVPTLGAYPITQIAAPELRTLLAKCEGRGGWTPIRVKTDISSIFEYAIVHGYCDSNPVPGLRGLVKTPPSESKAVLTHGQIRAFFAKLRARPGRPETRACLRLLALTACRPQEACSAEWKEIDADAGLWRIPAAKMKARRDHVVPLPAQLVDELAQLHAITGTGRYLFPSARDPQKTLTTSALRFAMIDFALAERASPHCWRTTFSTWANERGFRPDAIEIQLAHAERNKVRATYNKAILLEERTKMMQAWADYLASAEAENVVQLRPARGG
jgi:integrase